MKMDAKKTDKTISRRCSTTCLASVIVAGGAVLVAVALSDLGPVAHMWVNISVAVPVTVAAYMAIKYRNRCGRSALMIALATLLVAFNPRMMVSIGAHAFDLAVGPVLVALGFIVVYSERHGGPVSGVRRASDEPTLYVIDGGTRDPFCATRRTHPESTPLKRASG
jgi:hypothetical protein